MADDGQFSRTLLLAVDAWRYGTRDDLQQRDLQRALGTAVRESALRSDLDPARWQRQDAGDGMFTPITDGSAEPKVIGSFVRELDEWLGRYNHDLQPQARLRLRVAVHHGVAIPAALGHAGAAPVHVCRLRDARVVRELLEVFSEANLVLAVSEEIFEGSVRPRHTSLSVKDFTRVEVAEQAKEFFATAWVHVPGVAGERVGAQLDAFAVSLSFAGTAVPPPRFFEQAVCRSFDAIGAPGPEGAEASGEVLSFPVPAGLSGTVLTGTWIEHLRKNTGAQFPGIRLAAGIARAPDPAVACAEATRLAGSDAAGRLLAASTRSRLVIVVSEEVYDAVVSRGGRFVFPMSYRHHEAGTGCWFRVPGHSIPPDPGPPQDQPATGAGSPSATATTYGDHSTAIGHGTFTAPFIMGDVHQHGSDR
ncbi:hypothetical protein [Amycolatopsis sp. NPDC049159]|uniref:hypothetical protein n=1 Tax=Amycolatopsis sp. NPDC049159 TaxID=3157210 RepID=UPI003402CFFB